MTFRRFNSRLEELDAQVLGISCDHTASHRAWTLVSRGRALSGTLGLASQRSEVSKAYDLWNEERGVSSIRAVVVIDKEGVIRFRETYQPGTLPDPQTVLAAVASARDSSITPISRVAGHGDVSICPATTRTLDGGPPATCRPIDNDAQAHRHPPGRGITAGAVENHPGHPGATRQPRVSTPKLNAPNIVP